MKLDLRTFLLCWLWPVDFTSFFFPCKDTKSCSLQGDKQGRTRSAATSFANFMLFCDFCAGHTLWACLVSFHFPSKCKLCALLSLALIAVTWTGSRGDILAEWGEIAPFAGCLFGRFSRVVGPICSRALL